MKQSLLIRLTAGLLAPVLVAGEALADNALTAEQVLSAVQSASQYQSLESSYEQLRDAKQSQDVRWYSGPELELEGEKPRDGAEKPTYQVFLNQNLTIHTKRSSGVEAVKASVNADKEENREYSIQFAKELVSWIIDYQTLENKLKIIESGRAALSQLQAVFAEGAKHVTGETLAKMRIDMRMQRLNGEAVILQKHLTSMKETRPAGAVFEKLNLSAPLAVMNLDQAAVKSAIEKQPAIAKLQYREQAAREQSAFTRGKTDIGFGIGATELSSSDKKKGSIALRLNYKLDQGSFRGNEADQYSAQAAFLGYQRSLEMSSKSLMVSKLFAQEAELKANISLLGQEIEGLEKILTKSLSASKEGFADPTDIFDLHESMMRLKIDLSNLQQQLITVNSELYFLAGVSR